MSTAKSSRKLATKRAIKRPANSLATAASERSASESFTIAGVVVSAEGKPLVGLRVEAFDADQSRSTLLGATTSGLRGEYSIQYLETAFRRTPAEKGGPDLFIRVLDASGRMLFESPRFANAQPRQRIDAIIPLADTSALAGHYSVVGRITNPDLPSFDGLTAVIVEFLAGESKDLAPATVDRDGRFLTTFELPARKGRALPDLLVEVRDGKQVLGRSEVVIDARPGRVTIDVTLPGGVRTSKSEFDVVRAKLEGVFGARSERVDDEAFFEKLGYAAAKSGWDARALAMARLALKYEASAGKKAPLAAELFYALFRAGVPGSEGAPFRVPHRAASVIWTNAARDGVISSLSSKEIADAERRFAEAAAEAALKIQPVPGTSSLGDLLTVSLGDDDAAKRTVARLIGTHGNDTATFWEEVGSALGAMKRDRLKRDAALAELTLGNARIVSKLAKVLPADATNDTLALKGFGRPEAWADFVADADVPEAIEEGTTAQGRARYQEFLAAQVRLAHPVAALAADVADKTDKKQKFPVKETTRQRVADFLIKNRNGYRLGEEPLEHYLAKNQIEIDEDVRSEVKKIERVYQFTESDAQMQALLAAGIQSGYQAVQYTPSQFVTTFAPVLGGEALALNVFGKALQIQATIANVAISYQASQSGITIGPASAPLVKTQASEQDLSAANAGANVTLQSMFGELDYCACEHCRSILSPAAYFVNLLQLCESEETLHGGKVHPIDELAKRRPDLLQLPLTCENTNTLVPHIDLVNETLEYFVDSVDDASQPKPALSLDKFAGYSTDPVVPKAELINEPRNVRASAYTKLADAEFPLALPFNQSLESLRQYLKPFGLTLARAMEAVRVDDTPERPNQQSFAWSDLLLEELEFSRTEYTLLTDRSKSIRELYGFPPAGGGDPAVPQELRNAGAFARRVGISYEELTRVLQTRFVNPNSWVLPLASRLGVTLGQIKTFKATAPTAENDGDFEKQLSAGIDPAPYGGPVTGWIRNNADSILGLLTLFDTAAEPDPCDFSQKEFRYGDPEANNAKVRDIEFIRLLRFIRIWKKLKWQAESPDDPPVGWTIEEVDAVLTALYPMAYLPLDASEATNLQRLDDGCKILLRRLGALHRLSRLLEVSNAADLGALLACVAPMQGVGPGTLYQRLFLSTGFLREFPAFALDASARPLGDNSAQLAGAAGALQAAFQLTGADFDRIVVDVGSKVDTTLVPQSAAGLQPPSTALRDKLLELAQATGLASQPKPGLLQELLGRQPTVPETQYLDRHLRTEAVSRIFRRAWLARRLRMTVEELLALCRYTGLNIEAEIGAIDSAAPPNGLEALVLLVQSMRSAGLQPAEALQLLWGYDVLGAASSSHAAALSFAASVRADLAAVEAALVVTDDPDGARLQQLLASVLGAETADRYCEFVERKARTDVPYSQTAKALDSAVLQEVPEGLEYDHLNKRLAYTKGVMPDSIRDKLVALVNQPPGFVEAVRTLHRECREFLRKLNQPALSKAHDDYLKAPASAVDANRRQLLSDVIDAIKPLRRRQAALTRSTSTLGGTAQWVGDLLTRNTLLCSAQSESAEALGDFLAIGGGGLKGTFFASGVLDTGSETSDPELGSIDYGASPARALPGAGQSIAARWAGYLAIPAPGLFNIELELGAGVPALKLNGTPVTLQNGSGNAGLWTNAGPIQHAAGTLIPFELTVTGLKDRIRLSWQTAATSSVPVPATELYDAKAIGDLRTTYVRILRANALRQKLELGDSEALAVLSATSLRIGSGAQAKPLLGSLPVLWIPSDADAVAIGRAMATLAGYCRMRRELGATSEVMAQFLGDPVAALASSQSSFSRQSGWTGLAVDGAIARFNLAGGPPSREVLSSPAAAVRVHEALRILKLLGVGPVTAFAALTNAPASADVSSLYAALRSRHSAADWATLIKKVNDALRSRRRDALVAYALVGLANGPAPRNRINTPDRLYEYLLLDVSMHPRVETSRIRQAIAAVQQFIQRCVDLPGAEPEVQVPLALREQWPWMKRYRVWEANRKVFLYPENWLEPELRDDQSYIFRETMSELLQGDITEERAAEAMVGYLRKLEEIAMLEPCGLHVDTRETAGDATDDVLHVIARSSGANRKYYYRRRDRSAWMPWEPVKLDIEDNPVLPVRWKGRLFLFWLKVLQEAGTAATPTWSGNLVDQPSFVPPEPTHGVKALLCWSEYTKGKWGPTRTTSVQRAVNLGEGFTAPGGGNPFHRESYRLRAAMAGDSLDILIEEKVLGELGTLSSRAVGYRLYNSFAEPDKLPMPRARPGGRVKVTKWSQSQPARNIWAEDGAGANAVRIAYLLESSGTKVPQEELHALFGRKDGFAGSAVAPAFEVRESWHRTAPFFYHDARYNFFITPLSVERVESSGFNFFFPATMMQLAPMQMARVPATKTPDYRTSDERVEMEEEKPFPAGRKFVNKQGVIDY